MQKKKILIPMAVCAMLLPLSANASQGKNGCDPRNYNCGKNRYENFCFDSEYCFGGDYRCTNKNWNNGGSCLDSNRPAATSKPTSVPCATPTVEPTVEPTTEPTVEPTAVPTVEPTAVPTVKPTATPTTAPTKAPVTDNTGTESSSASAEVLRLVNEYRQQNGLSALTRNAELDRAAAIRASEIAEVFSHTRPDGSSWSTVSSLAYGENIAMGYSTADKVMTAWMNSSGHRANILKSSYGSIGIAAVEINGTMHWVQLFGK